MQIDAPSRRPGQESIVPMINVVFLLLIFFLMTSQIAPPDPVEVTAPRSQSGGEPEAPGEDKLFVNADGVPHLGETSGDAVYAALAGRGPEADPLLLVVDRKLEAARLAEMLRRLTALGAARVELVVSPE
ncbi:ExbD/TolR family protein [Pukyongiella litopenaei]|uniref:Biopolymer transporter ExbD n=1 Tax=Pukyongiella litopenaei TaxID=2605946 RepID=A0A2S0MU34_9RHOB|nr:biopolymer transporter ExbD [Pukyongiella litopenaei]AVO39410.1 biopolymer transporter ExbD [Pukyongiella litopenaei]